MTLELAVLIIGLAIADSFNPATIVSVALILLTVARRPGWTAAAVVLGAVFTVVVVGAVIFVTAGAVAGAVDGVLVVLRFVAFGAAGTGLVVAGVRRLRDRPRPPLDLPAWFTPATALPFGVMVTAADLPNAFPFFVALERMLDAGIDTATGLIVIAGYALLYCVPCLVLLAVGLSSRDRTRAWLQKLTRRFTEGSVRRSVPTAIALILIGAAVASIPAFLLAAS